MLLMSFQVLNVELVGDGRDSMVLENLVFVLKSDTVETLNCVENLDYDSYTIPID